jgi:hypothetical protein
MWPKVDKSGLKLDGGDLSSLQPNFSNLGCNLDKALVHEMTKIGNVWLQPRQGIGPWNDQNWKCLVAN